MEDVEYSVISHGEVLEGFDREQVIQALSALFKQPPEKIALILENPRTRLKSGLSEAKANQYQAALTKAGLKVSIEPASTPVTSVPSPATGDTPASAVQASGAARERDLQDEEETRTIPFSFKGDGKEYFKIWIVNLFLTILTLGVYSAWAKVRNKKYFYGNTSLDNSSFEYTGDPVAILKGRLIAGVFFILYASAGNFSPVLSAIMFMILLLVMPWMITRSLMFNARNSVYRNVSFRFQGDIKEAFLAFALWPLAAGLTLGILAPVAIYKQQHFFVNNHKYGTAPFEFSAVKKDYYIAIGIIVLTFIGCIVGGLVLDMFIPPAGIFLILGGYLMAFVLFSVKIFNLRFNNSVLIHHGFTANMEVKSYAILVVVNTIATIVTLGLFRPYAMVRTARYKTEHLNFQAQGDLNAFIAEEEQEMSALGEEMGDMFDFDIGL
ncbi:YjgN family protein [Kaarinaea lacus]